jgi:hypothetical protein
MQEATAHDAVEAPAPAEVVEDDLLPLDQALRGVIESVIESFDAVGA